MKRPWAAIIAISVTLNACMSTPLTARGDSQGFIKTPGDSLHFWQTVMTPAVALKYQARGSTTYCNVFVADMIKEYFGPGIYKRVLPQGVKAPDIVYREWQSNPHLFSLDPKSYSLRKIQALADQGYVVLLAYYNSKGKSHLAFVGNSKLVMFTVPAIKKLEGKTASLLGAEWLPAVVQAGTYAGVTSVVYATNGWFSSAVNPFNAGIVKFFLIKASA